MFSFFKKFLKNKSTIDKDGCPFPVPPEVRYRFRLPNGKEFYVYAIDPKLKN